MENQKPTVIFLIGGPGSGKGTVCTQILENYPFIHLSTGDLLREEVKNETELGKIAEEYMKEGKMVPADKLVEILKSNMIKLGWEKNIYILDGFPRNFSNIENWELIMKDDINEIGVINLSCSKEILKERIMKRGETSGRDDDNEEAFEKRMNVFFEETQPVVDHFKNKEKLFEVDASGSIENTFEKTKQIIDNFKLDVLIESINLRNYLKNKVDPYMKSLLKYLYKNKNEDIIESIQNWINSDAIKIKEGESN